MDIVDKIKEKYPNPKPVRGVHGADEYCVGGAICLYWAGKESIDIDDEAFFFPSASLLGHHLRKFNPNLPPELARAYAKLITEKNDEGNFETAWHVADSALEYAPREED